MTETTVTGVAARRQTRAFDLHAAVAEALRGARVRLKEGDVLVVSSKYAAVSQGRIVRERSIRASQTARELAARLGMREALAEAVVRESDEVVGGAAGFAMATTGGMLAPNAGIDCSNAGEGNIVLYPDSPHELAEQLRRRIFLVSRVRVGVVLSDSRLMPMRAGTTGVAVAFAGIEPLADERGRADLDGAPLGVTVRAVADGIASMANHAMGEAAESVPMAVVRGAGAQMTDRRAARGEASVSRDECVYARGLR